MSDVLGDERELLEKAIDAALPDEALAKLKNKARSLANEISESIEYDLRDSLATNLAQHAKDMAARVIEAFLTGNEYELRRWLGCTEGGYTGRSDGCTFGRERPISEWHSVIHGKLFETGGVALRRKVVELHRDLIESQRILDLEDQVRSLVEQNNILRRERDAAREELRGYR